MRDEPATKTRRWLIAAGLGLLLAGGAGPHTAAAGARGVTAGEFIVDPPTLINLGFEWFDRRRRQPQRGRRGLVPQAGRRRRGSGRCRCCGCRASGSTTASSSTSSSPNMFAGSILDLEPDTAYEARVRADGSGRRPRRGAEDRDRAHAARAEAGRRRPRRSTSTRTDFKGTKIEPAFEGLMCAYNLTCSGTDWATAGRPRVQAGRHDPRARRPLQVQPLRVHEQPGGEPHRAARRHLLPDRRRHGRAADRDQGRRRRRGDLRRRRQLRAVRRQGRRLHLLRGAHVPQHRHRDLGRHAVHRRARRG